MEIREAILRAAGWIENDPTLFNFYESHVPECGSPGCAIGLIGCAAGLEAGKPIDHLPGLTATSFLGLKRHTEFYERMNLLAPRGWCTDIASCAAGMRLYADKYHPEEKTGLIEDPAFAKFRDTLERVTA